MNEAEKEQLIKKDIESIENRVRHAFNQGYEMEIKSKISELPSVNPNRKMVDKPIMHYEESWDRLYTWLNDMRFSIAPDETVTDVDERNDRSIQVNLLDEIMMIMNDMEEK